MSKVRKIELVARKVSFAEAEEADDLYYANLTPEERLKECFDLRRLNYFGGKENNLPGIEKVIFKINRKLHEK
ncbi:MAG: hypothetical protein ABIW38_13645 [Ferruginibacter sp.]